MQARYRSDYAGEFIVLETRWSGGKKNQSREWIANPIENHHISGRAACIASAIDAHRFDHTVLQRHRGGLRGSKKLQTYCTGSVAKEMRGDFVVETNPEQLNILVDTQTSEKSIVYTSNRNCLRFPAQFYLIPLNPHLLDLVTLLYLAAFDGHHEVFMLGYNKETPVENPGWIDQVSKVIQAYESTKFYCVGERTNMPEVWLDFANYQTMSHQEFISHCDV